MAHMHKIRKRFKIKQPSSHLAVFERTTTVSGCNWMAVVQVKWVSCSDPPLFGEGLVVILLGSVHVWVYRYDSGSVWGSFWFWLHDCLYPIYDLFTYL